LDDGTLRTFSLAAIQDLHGQVRGQANLIIHGDEIARGSIKIDCLRIIDHTALGYYRAVVSGWIDQINEPFDQPDEYRYAVFTVFERYDGTDYVGDGLVFPTNYYNCHNVIYTGRAWPVENGSIHITP
jgi:hypothetical protein